MADARVPGSRVTGTRHRILDALEETLLEVGPGGATLECVAERAGVSKGGLLYHFPSKEALYEGLLDRLVGVTKSDQLAMQGAPESAVDYYLDVSAQGEDGYQRSVLAALLLIGVKEIDVRAALARSLNTWFFALNDQLGDPVRARIIQLVGDGLYLHALVGSDYGELDRKVIEQLRPKL